MKNLSEINDKDRNIVNGEDSFIQVIVELHQKLGKTFETNFNNIREINYKINQDIDEIQSLIAKEEKIQKDLKEKNNLINSVLNDFMNTMQATISNNNSK